MKRPPRKPEKRFFGWNKLIFSLFKGILLLAMVIGVYFIAIKEGHKPGEVRAIAFSALIIGNVFLILTSLSKTRSFIAVIKEKKLIILLIPVLALIMLLLTISLPFLQKVFNFEFPGYQHFVVSLVGAVLMLGLLELVKKVGMRKRRG